MSKCEHGRQKSRCVLCGGSEICEHGKRKSRCILCGGSEICEHKRIKSQCKLCKGSSICEHERIKSQCKLCKGSSICEHERIKSHCKLCGGSEICEHGKRKSRCILCGGSEICEHGKHKSRCKKCKGGSICEHERIKSTCKLCKGGSICEHERIKSHCKLCGGSSFCEHGKRKSYCKFCGGSSLCKSTWCETYGNPKYDGYCVPCFVNNPENQYKPAMRNYKTKEKDVVDRIIQEFPDFTWIADKKIAYGCSRRRPDLLLDLGSHIIIIEVDENKHDTYECSCENKRLMELSQDLNHRPIVFIRFNPDAYTNQEGLLVKSCWKLNKLGVITIQKRKENEWIERIIKLKQQIQHWVNNTSEKTIDIIELFY